MTRDGTAAADVTRNHDEVDGHRDKRLLVKIIGE